MLKALAVVVTAPLMVAEAFLGPLLGIVEVREKTAGGMHLWIPVPILLAQGAPLLLPEEAVIPLEGHGRPDFSPETAAAAVKLLEVLRDMPDVELVRVEDGEETVSVRKKRDRLEVHIRAPGEEVQTVLPISLAAELAKTAESGALKPTDLSAALRKLPRGKIVHVRDHEHEVRIWVF